MTDLLLSAVAFTALVALGLAVLAALTVVPFVLALRAAEQRGFPPARWGALALAGSVLGVGVALLVVRSELPTALALLALPVSYLGVLVLAVLEPGQALGGRAGRHA